LERLITMNEHFKPINCQRCGTVVWEGISWAGFAKKLDKKKLTIEEEIVKRLSGLMTYEIYRTSVSFEAVERSLIRIEGSQREKIVLADHTCSNFTLFDTEVPEYFKKPVMVKQTFEEAPF